MELQVIQNKIHEIRGFKVMLDFDLAEMYSVENRRLKEQVKRNKERFPDDFMFQLTKNEWNELVAICDKFPESIKHSPVSPLAFTQEGVAMLSGILRSSVAIQVNIQIMRAFVNIRQFLLNTNSLHYEIEKLRNQLILLNHDVEDLVKDHENYDNHLDDIYMALTELAKKQKTIEKPRNKIGFKTNE